jgi:hypothetical protein
LYDFGHTLRNITSGILVCYLANNKENQFINPDELGAELFFG